MKPLTTTSCVLTFALLAGGASLAAPMMGATGAVRADETAAKTISGTVESVAVEDRTFVLIVEQTPESAAERVTVRVDDDTRYTLNGEASTMDEALRAERKAKAAIEDGIAVRVDVKTREY